MCRYFIGYISSNPLVTIYLSYKNCQSEFVFIRLWMVWLNSWKHQRLLSMSYGRKTMQSKENLQIWLENGQWAFLQKPAGNLAKKYCVQQPKHGAMVLLENRNRYWIVNAFGAHVRLLLPHMYVFMKALNLDSTYFFFTTKVILF